MVVAPISAADIAPPQDAPSDTISRDFGGVSRKPRTGGLAEGKRLEMMVWGGGGAIIGSVAGPVGAIIGGAVGAIAGLVVAVVIVPRNGPDKAELAARAARRR
jgi:hypothetical protein